MRTSVKLNLIFFIICYLFATGINSQTVFRNGTNCQRAINIDAIGTCSEQTYEQKGNYWFYFVADSSNNTINVKQNNLAQSGNPPISYIAFFKGSCNNQFLLDSSTVANNDSINIHYSFSNVSVGDSCFINIAVEASPYVLTASICRVEGIPIHLNPPPSCINICNGELNPWSSEISPFENPGVPCWTLGYGTPQIKEESTGNGAAYMWSYFSAKFPGGEAIMYKFASPLIQNANYYLSYKVRGASGSSASTVDFFKVQLTNASNSSLPHSSDSPSSFYPSQLLDSEANLAVDGPWITKTICFQPQFANQDAVVFYPEDNTGIGYVFLDDVVVLKIDDQTENLNSCPGNSVTLNTHCNIISNANYSWTPATDLSCTDCAEPITTPSITASYTCSVTLAGGCTYHVYSTVDPSVTPAPAPIAIFPATMCNYTPFQVTLQNGVPGYSYTWQI